MAGERTRDESVPAKAHWRTKTAAGKSVSHRWQQVAASRNGKSQGNARNRLKSAFWFLMLVSTGVAFVYLMNFRPRQTPVIALVATRYEAPFLPNSWAFEDLEAIRRLDGETILLFDTDDSRSTRAALMVDFDQLLASAIQSSEHDVPMIIYLSMHADVNDQGEPCLIPSAGSALESDTWIPLDELIRRADIVRDTTARPLLFVLDCHRHAPNWQRCEVSDQFVTQVESAIRASKVANLTVMTSCSTGEQSVAAPMHRQTAFGYFFATGLAGKADVSPPGNNDNYVTLSELSRFVTANVAHFASTALGVAQEVEVFSTSEGSGAADFVVCWVTTDQSPQADSPITTGRQIESTDLWARYETVRAWSPFHLNPLSWGRVESEILRLDELINGGAAYQAPAACLKTKISESLDELQSAIEHESIEDGQEVVRSQLKPLQHLAGEADFAAALQEIRPIAARQENVELHFARLIAAQRGSSLWTHPRSVSAALETRTVAEETTQNLSPEVLSWTINALAEADAVRRSTEDLFFAGQDTENLFRDARQLYEAASSRAQATRLAIDIRNRAFAELFWYSCWSASRAGASAEDSVRELIEKTELLARAIQESTAQQQSGTALRFTPVASEVARGLDALHLQLSLEYTELLGDDPQLSAEQIHRAQSLLRIPLLPSHDSVTEATGSRQRESLSRRLRETVANRIANPDLAGNDAKTQVDTTVPSDRIHVLSRLFAMPDDSVADTNQPEKSAEMWKRAAQLRSTIRDLSKISETAVMNTAPSVESYRNGVVTAASKLRVAAPVGAKSVTVDAVAVQQRLDRTLLHLWQCERTLNDFYGPANQTSEPYFSVAAERYLRSFGSSLSESVAVQTRLAEINRLLNRRLTAVSGGFDMHAQDVLLMNGVQLEPVDVFAAVSAKLPQDAFPLGTGNICLATADNLALSEALIVPLNREAPDGRRKSLGRLSLRGAAVPGEIFAVTNVRGNRFRKPILVSRAAGIETRLNINNSDRVTFKVNGTAAAGTSVIVIFDCSQSMAAQIPVEGPGQQQTRFLAAKRALFDLLQKLADQKDARVGLTFFGHRVGWNPQQPKQLLQQTGYARGIPTDLRPFEDVESLLPVGRFDSAVLQSIEPIIESTVPWGETPLFLAVTEAITELAGEDHRRSRRIIVLTDGANHQVNPTALRRRTLSDVLQVLPDNIRVDVVGFRISDADAQQATAEFESVTASGGGAFIPVDDVNELAGSLSGLIETAEFEVKLSTGEVIMSTAAEEITVSMNEPVLNASIRAGDAQQTVVLTGGEAVELQLSDDKQQLFVPRWWKGNPQFTPLGNGIPFAASAIECGVQAVQRREDAAAFSFSLQHVAQRFLSRPASVQVAVFPAGENGGRIGAGYLTDVDAFEMGTPVPSFSFAAMDWPEKATHAEIHVSVQFEAGEPTDAMRLSELQLEGTTRSHHRLLAGLQGVDAFVMIDDQQPNLLTIIEKHEHDSAGLDALVVRLRSAAGPSRKIRRTDTQSRLVATIFEFQIGGGVDLANDVVEFILQEDLQRNSLHFLKPVTLPVSTNDGLLIPTSR